MAPDTAALWWHAFGGLVDLAQDEHGNPAPAWMMVKLCESTRPPGEWLGEPLHHGTSLLSHIGSWDHEPTKAEMNAVTPEEYRDDAR